MGFEKVDSLVDRPFTPPYGAHSVLYEEVDRVFGPDFRQSSSGQTPKQRRDDYLLTTALFIDVPDGENDKTKLYFATNMIASASDRDADTQRAILSNLTSIIDDEWFEEQSEFKYKIEVVARYLSEVETAIRKRDVELSTVIQETLQGVRGEGTESYFARWGSARDVERQNARSSGWGKYGL